MSSRTCSRGGPDEEDDDLDVVDAERNVKLSKPFFTELYSASD
jgi:hypothetical protein